jgi:hypothetical protein
MLRWYLELKAEKNTCMLIFKMIKENENPIGG